ncbi:MAG: tetratricopeptide repeat protein, partial [Planctomycetota bacterium]
VERFLDGFPVVARDAGVAYRASKFVRRNLVAVIAAAAVALALVGGIASSLRLAKVASVERDIAAAATMDAVRERDAAGAARHRAEHEAEHARIEASSNHIVAEFLGDTFLSGQFVVRSDQRAKVLATIDRKAGQVRRQYRDNEHLRANLLDALGRASAAVDAFEQAEALLLEAAKIRSQCFGDESLERALSLSSLGQLYYRQGRLPEALAALRECDRLHRELPRDVHTDVARAANDLAAAERAIGNVERARQLHLEALALRRMGDDQVLVAESLNNLANSEPDLALASEHLSEALRLRTEVLGPDDPLTIQSAANLGTLSIRVGDFAKARTLLRDAVERSRQLAGLGADALAVSLRLLAYAELRCEDLDAAEAAIDEALAIEQQRFGPLHARVATCLEVRASIEERRGVWPLAVETWREVLRVRVAGLPAGHRQIALTNGSLGVAMARSGAVEDGSVLIREALAVHEAASPPAMRDIVDCKLQLALAEDLAGRSDAAERLLLDAVQASVAEPHDTSRVMPVRVHLHDFYRRHGRVEEAKQYEDAAGGTIGR